MLITEIASKNGPTPDQNNVIPKTPIQMCQNVNNLLHIRPILVDLSNADKTFSPRKKIYVFFHFKNPKHQLEHAFCLDRINLRWYEKDELFVTHMVNLLHEK